MVIAVVTALAHLVVSSLPWAQELFYAAGFVPARVAEPDLLDHADLVFPILPLLVTPLTATLLHGGWLHLGFNLLMLVFCGRQVEFVLGGRLLLLLYAVGAYAAALGQWALGPSLPVPMIGASGAISAVMGAYALLYSDREVKGLGPIPASWVRMLWLGASWVVLQFLIGIASTSGPIMGTDSAVAVGAHVGGFIAGMLLTGPLLRARFRRRGPVH